MAKKAVSLRFGADGESQAPVNTAHKPRTVIQRTLSAVGSVFGGRALSPNLSPQQLELIAFAQCGEGNGILAAVAGSGKTFSSIEVCKAVDQRLSVAFMAYNKSISEESKAKVAALGLGNVEVGTCHSFGLKAIRAVYPNIRIDKRLKDNRMLADAKVPEPLKRAVLRLVSLAKQTAVGVAWDVTDYRYWNELIDRYDVKLLVQGTGGYASEQLMLDALIDHSINGLALAQEIAQNLIDFDDMIWIPLIENMQFRRYDWIIVDEAQDLNLSRRMMCREMLKPVTGRALFAGDPHQAIYAFSGADAKSIENIRQEYNATMLPLTTTYRCSKAAVKLAQKFVPHIEAGADNLDGAVHSITPEKFMAMVEQRTIGGGDAILCRMTKPLVKLCLKLIAADVPAFVEGRDIGKQLEALASKWKVENIGGLVTNLEAHRIAETRRLVEQDAEYQIEGLNDRLDALLAIMSGCDTVADLKSKISRLFDDTEPGEKVNRVTLSTVHKSKGREWERVFIWGWDRYMPSRRARQDWEKESERNLQYVAVTRTKDQLYLVDGEED